MRCLLHDLLPPTPTPTRVVAQGCGLEHLIAPQAENPRWCGRSPTPTPPPGWGRCTRILAFLLSVLESVVTFQLQMPPPGRASSEGGFRGARRRLVRSHPHGWTRWGVWLAFLALSFWADGFLPTPVPALFWLCNMQKTHLLCPTQKKTFERIEEG